LEGLAVAGGDFDTRDPLREASAAAEAAAQELPATVSGFALALAGILEQAVRSAHPGEDEAAYNAISWFTNDEDLLPFSTQCQLVREILGATAEPVPFDPAWLSWQNGTVGRITAGIWEERAFDRLPVLADALEEAGCQVLSILRHCRQSGGHSLGCWVIDFMLRRPR
jgi:hypothetical protein